MVTITQVQKGLATFVDNEMMKNMKGVQSWLFGASAGIALSRTGEIFQSIKDNPIVKALGVITEDGEIDIDLISDELMKQAEKTGSRVINIPMIGAFNISKSDINKLAEYIKNS